ncbi:hypothetical protein cypCar_00029318, partial [Cyprinus carpio]
MGVVFLELGQQQERERGQIKRRIIMEEETLLRERLQAIT